MTHWAMVIDLDCCVGCKACILGCTQANLIPEGMWRKLCVSDELAAPGKERITATRSCMHCENPPCEEVCPTGATYKRDDGIVEIKKEKCVGCGYCVLACPYDARTIYEPDHTFNSYGLSKTDIKNSLIEKREGICTKCNFCREKVESGIKNNLKPGVDEEATPACILMCSAGALYFGDLDDPKSNVSELLNKRKSTQMFSGYETNPSVYYLINS